MYQFAAAFFLVTLLSQICSIGALVGTSLSTVGSWSTCLVVAFQTLGVLLGIFISQSAKRNPRSLVFKPDLLNFGSAVASVMIVALPTMNLLWLAAMLVRSSSGAILGASMLASARSYSTDIAQSNKTMQIARTAAFVVALSTAPLLAGVFGTRNIFVLDAVGSAILAIWLWNLRHLTLAPAHQPTKGTSTHVATSISKESLPAMLLLVLAVIYLSWCAGGIFHVLEVQILKDRFNLSAEWITGVFLITGLANLFTVKLIPAAKSPENLLRIFLISAIGIFVCTLSYLYVGTLPLLVATVICLGVANGAFTLTQTGLIQNFDEAAVRLNGFLYTRLASQAGLLTSTCAVLLLSKSADEFRSVSILVAALGLVTLLIAARTIAGRSRLSGAAATIILTGCLLSSTSKAENTDTLRVPLREIPASLDPQVVVDISSAMVTNQIFENLYSYAADNSLVPDLAVKHTISQDGKSIIITIREDHTFSDGTPVTAIHAVAALNRAALTLGDSIGWGMQDIVGFDQVAKKRAKTISGVNTLSKFQLKIDLTRPSPRLLQILTATGFAIGLEKDGSWLGSGEYEIDHVNRPAALTLKKRSNAQRDAVSKIVFIASRDQAEDEQLLRAGKVDIASLDSKPKPAIPGYTKIEQDYLQAVVFLLNKKSPRFKTAEQRCSFVRSFKRSAIDSGYLWQPMDLGLPFAHDIFDPKKPDSSALGKGAGSITIMSTDSVAKFTGELNANIAAKMSKLGYKVDFKRTVVKGMVKDVRSKNFDAVAYGYLLDYADPDALFSPLLGTGQQYNLINFSDATIDSLLRVGRSIADKEARNALYQEAASILKRGCEVSFLGGQKVDVYYSNKFSIPRPSSLGFHRMALSKVRRIHDETKQ